MKEENKDSMMHIAMKYIMNVIKTCQDLGIVDSSNQSMIQRILHHIQQIRNLKDSENKDIFYQEA